MGLLLVAGVADAAQPITVTDLPGVTVRASILRTDSPSLTPPTQAATRWAPLSQTIGQGFGKKVYWIRLELNVPREHLDKPVVLRYQPPNTRDIRVYLPGQQPLAIGTEVPFTERPMGLPDVAVSVLPDTSTLTVFVRLASVGRAFGTFELMSERSYYQSQSTRLLLHGIFYGVLLLALLVNLASWAFTRQTIYGMYVGFVGLSLLASLAANGYLHALLPDALAQHHSTLQLLAFSGMAATAIVFASRLFCLDSRKRWIDRGIDAFALIMVVMALPATVWSSWRPYAWESVLLAFSLYGLASLTAGTRQLLAKRSSKNTLIFMAYLAFVVSQWVTVGAVLGLLPATELNVGMWQVGLIVHLVLLQLMLVIDGREQRWLTWQQQARLDTLKEQAQAAARRSRDLQQFLERITHEFKTPLAVIDSSVQSLRMLDLAPSPERSVRYDRIRRAVTRLNDLLMRSVVAERTELAASSFQSQPTELPALLEAALGELSEEEIRCDRDCQLTLKRSDQTGEQVLRLTWVGIHQPESVFIDADVGRLQTALYHLFDNALKYGVPEHHIAVCIKWMTTKPNQQVVDISVINRCDESISEAELPLLFDKYHRRPECGNVSGAGVGLYMARQVVEQHAGRLVAQLAGPGQIVFHIELPVSAHTPHEPS